MGQPDTSHIVFDEIELECIDGDTFDKIALKMTMLKERIDSQCKVNTEHDKLHK